MNPITRTLALPLLAIALQPAFAAEAAQPVKPGSSVVAAQTASTITTADGVQLYYRTGARRTARWLPSATAGR